MKKLFRKRGIFFIPSSLTGGIIFLIALAYSVYSFIEIDSRSHSASDTIRPFIIRLVLIWIIYSVIAYISGYNKEKE
jgi:Na+/glutamate symporter